MKSMANTSCKQLADQPVAKRAAPNPETGLEGAQTLVMSTTKITYAPYDPLHVSAVHVKMIKEFGKMHRDWGFQILDIDIHSPVPSITVKYWFQNDQQAMMFILKFAN